MFVLPEFSYHVTVMWPDGDVLTCEHQLDRDAAFEEAADRITKNGCKVRVEMIERDPDTGACIGVSNVTSEMLAMCSPEGLPREADLSPDHPDMVAGRSEDRARAEREMAV